MYLYDNINRRLCFLKDLIIKTISIKNVLNSRPLKSIDNSLIENKIMINFDYKAVVLIAIIQFVKKNI